MPRYPLVMLLTLLVSACAGTSPPTHFYRLEAPTETAPAMLTKGVVIGLGPLSLPDILDRPQIVTQTGAYRLNLAEFHRWAGDLKANVGRLLGASLASRLGAEQVALYPWPRYRKLDYQIQLDVTRFDGSLGGEARLEGAWSLLDGEGRQEQLLEPFSLRQAVPGSDYADLVAVLSRLVIRLADDMAGKIAQRSR